VDQDALILLGARASRVENQDAIDACIVGMLGDPKEVHFSRICNLYFPLNSFCLKVIVGSARFQILQLDIPFTQLGSMLSYKKFNERRIGSIGLSNIQGFVQLFLINAKPKEYSIFEGGKRILLNLFY
jgi:hypothetical protein